MPDMDKIVVDKFEVNVFEARTDMFEEAFEGMWDKFTAGLAMPSPGPEAGAIEPEDLENLADDIGDEVGEGVSKAFSEGAANLAESILNTGEELAKSITQGNEYTAEATEALGYSFLGPLYPVFKSLKELGPIRWGIDKIKTGVTAIWDKTKEYTTKFFGWAWGGMKTMFGGWFRKGRQGTEEIGDKVKKGTGGIFWAILALPLLLFKKFGGLLRGLKALFLTKFLPALSKLAKIAVPAAAMVLSANDLRQLYILWKKNADKAFSTWNVADRVKFGEHVGATAGTATGAAVGFAFGGPFGAMIGAILGRVVGGYIGEYIGGMWPWIERVGHHFWIWLKAEASMWWEGLKESWAAFSTFIDKWLIQPLKSLGEMLAPVLDPVISFFKWLGGIAFAWLGNALTKLLGPLETFGDVVMAVLKLFVTGIPILGPIFGRMIKGLEKSVEAADKEVDFKKVHVETMDEINKRYEKQGVITSGLHAEGMTDTLQAGKKAVTKLVGKDSAPKPKPVEPERKIYESKPMLKDNTLLHEAQKAQTEETKAVRDEVKKSNELLKKIAEKPEGSTQNTPIPVSIPELGLVQ